MRVYFSSTHMHSMAPATGDTLGKHLLSEWMEGALSSGQQIWVFLPRC